MVVGGGQRGSNIGRRNIAGQRGGNMVVGSSQRGSTVNKGRVSVSLSLTLANDMSVVEPIVRGSIGGQRGGNIWR